MTLALVEVVYLHGSSATARSKDGTVFTVPYTAFRALRGNGGHPEFSNKQTVKVGGSVHVPQGDVLPGDSLIVKIENQIVTAWNHALVYCYLKGGTHKPYLKVGRRLVYQR